MFEPGKMHNVVQEMQRLKIDVLGISEARWPNSGNYPVAYGMVYFSGNRDTHHRNGVAIVISKTMVPSVINFVPVSDRVIFLQLQTKTGKLNIIQGYAPTADKSDEEVEQFYEQIDQVLRSTKPRDSTIILGDFNSKIGKGKSGKHVGEYGLGIRNERGDRLLQFCQENDMIITNTFFKLPNRRLYTWKSPQDNDNNIVRNQIDFLLVNERYRNSIKSVKTYPGADVYSDHNLLLARLHIKLKLLTQKTKTNQLDISCLSNPKTKQQLQQAINKNLKTLHITEKHHNTGSPDDQWQTLKAAIMKPAETILIKKKQKEKQEWMTDKILQLMALRRTFKGKCEQKYKQIHNEIRLQIRIAKEDFYKKKCDEIEELQMKHDSFNVHKKVKELAGTQKRKQPSTLYNSEGKIITELEERLKAWWRYVNELFTDERQEPNLRNGQEDEGPEITKDEVIYALKRMRNGKSPGPDELPVELLKLIEERSINTLVDLFNNIYQSGIIPQEWLLSTFVTMPKKGNPRQCSDYRTISLMSHILKTFLKIIHTRIHRKLEIDISDTQFGFRNGVGTREALFALNVMSQRCLDINQDLYICFIDYNKAFDKVRHDQVIKLLTEKNLDKRDIRIISNLYYNQKATVRVGNDMTEEIQIKRGVRQGCILSPTLFNLYSEEIINKAISNLSIGIKINGILINNLRYADDTILVAETLGDLQTLVNNIVECSEDYGLSLNIGKTKFMLITKSSINNVLDLRAYNQTIERVTKYNYLGTMINENNDCAEEIKIRIEKARAVFTKMKRVFCGRDLSLELKVRLMRCYVLSVLFYGVETWTMKKIDIKKIDAFEMWMYRRMLRISWTQKITNVEVMRRMHKEREVILTIKKRKLQYLGHITRGRKYQLLQTIMQGKIAGKRSVGRRRNSWLKNLREWYNCSNNQLFRSAVSKVRIALMIANLRNEDGT